MNYSKIQTNGSARDDALKRRSNAVREALGMGPAPQSDAENHSEQKEGREAKRVTCGPVTWIAGPLQSFGHDGPLGSDGAMVTLR